METRFFTIMIQFPEKVDAEQQIAKLRNLILDNTNAEVVAIDRGIPTKIEEPKE